MIKVISTEDIITINKRYASGILLRQGLDSIYASYMYYETEKEQICSIFQNLIKGHYFIDGNKRTAVVILLSITKINNIKTKLTDDNLFNITIDIASSNYSVEDIIKMIF